MRNAWNEEDVFSFSSTYFFFLQINDGVTKKKYEEAALAIPIFMNILFFFKADKERKRKTSHHNLDLLEDVNSFCLKWLSERLIDDANMKNDLFTSMLNMLMRPLSQ